MKIALVAHDAAPSRAFVELATYLNENSLAEVTALTAHAKRGDAFPDELIQAAVAEADFVLCGISEPVENAAMEILAAEEAWRRNIPFGFYADAKGAWRRRSIARFRNNATLILVATNAGEGLLDAIGMFPYTEFVRTGNPLWEPYFAPGDEVAARALARADKNDFVILSPGTKEPIITIQLWAAVVEAAHLMQSSLQKVVILTQHPGDQTPSEMYLGFRDVAPPLDVRIIGPAKLPSDQYVPGVDAVVGNMNSSVSLHALCRRKGVVDYYGPISQERLRRVSGSPFGHFHQSGAVIDVYSASSADLRVALDRIARNPKLLRLHQELHAPPLKQGEAVKKMFEAIQKVMARQ